MPATAALNWIRPTDSVFQKRWRAALTPIIRRLLIRFGSQSRLIARSNKHFGTGVSLALCIGVTLKIEATLHLIGRIGAENLGELLGWSANFGRTSCSIWTR